MSALPHILASPEPDDEPPPPPPPRRSPAASSNAQHIAPMPSQQQQHQPDDDEHDHRPRAMSTPKPDQSFEKDPQITIYTSTTTTTRRNANGATSSVFSGNKIRHLKKDDGVPLWRKDIQYDFLRLVFDDPTPCFTKYSDGTTGHTFAAVYIDAMAKSSKCSKILKEKLLADQEGAIAMAMVCLLVNVGRMNTTLNFFPEMRAQLRTYHSIPALQARQDPNAYKQLQDAPRLKSILKGATEDDPQPSTLEEVRAALRPRTNPVNLLFVMSQYAPKVSEQHFPLPRDFFDLFMRTSLSSKSRAEAFLWLMYWYMESDFSPTDAQHNPFGPGRAGEDENGNPDTDAKRVYLESLVQAQADMENVDTEEEIQFGETKRKERIAILASDPSPAMTALKRARKEKGLAGGIGANGSEDEGSEVGWHRGQPTSAARGPAFETGSEYTRSPSPVISRGFQAVNVKPAGDVRIRDLLNSDYAAPEPSPPQIAPAHAAPPPAKKGPGRGNWRRSRPKAEPSASGALRSSQDSSHHVPLLPNTGHLSFVADGPPPMHPATPSSGAHFHTLSPDQSTIIQSALTLSSHHTPAHPNTGPHVPTPSYQAQKRHRGVTQHQSAVLNHRKQQIEYQLDRRIRKLHRVQRARREAASPVLRAWKRIRLMAPDYDSEEEAIKLRKARERAAKADESDWRGGGAVAPARGKENAQHHDDPLAGAENAEPRPRVLYAGFVRGPTEPADVGEEVRALAAVFRRAARRLERWSEARHPGEAMARRVERERWMRQQRGGGRAKKQRGSGTAGRGYVLGGEREAGRGGEREFEPYDDDGGGGGELDQEDRELLGEVDADESDGEEDEDEMDVD